MKRARTIAHCVVAFRLLLLSLKRCSLASRANERIIPLLRRRVLRLFRRNSMEKSILNDSQRLNIPSDERAHQTMKDKVFGYEVLKQKKQTIKT